MIKLRNPFTGTKIGDVYITQTYHSGSNNIAVDLVVSGINGGTPVYAMRDGIVYYVDNNS